MTATQRLEITLPAEMARYVRAKVASGEYATASDVISDGLIESETTFEQWLRDEAGPAYDALIADPTNVASSEDVRAGLAAMRAKALAKV